ncbi:unnamed protein product [Nesidiocoris tenuis]|uniref:Dynein heavy chain tail domain-containing protein n=1 Tax=Nesidiocoris tenuis TaxID=355587 RepID=A0A6H5H843_9HEMI|nr:unnamed protein product [Nesidiocoris tenuis]
MEEENPIQPTESVGFSEEFENDGTAIRGDEMGAKEDPRVVWLLERILAFFQTEDMSLVVRMLKRNDSRALRNLYRYFNDDSSTYWNGFFVYQTQFARRYRKDSCKYRKHLIENENAVDDGDEEEEEQYYYTKHRKTTYRNATCLQLHLHFDINCWHRFPLAGKIVYFLPRSKSFAPIETIQEAQSVMPRMFYMGAVDVSSMNNLRAIFTVLQSYLRKVFLGPTNPHSPNSRMPVNLIKTVENLKPPSTFPIETSSSYVKKYDDIVNFFKSEDVPITCTLNTQLLKTDESHRALKPREKFSTPTIDDFLTPEFLNKVPQIRRLLKRKKNKGFLMKSKDRVKMALEDLTPPKSSILNSIQQVIDQFDWCLAKISHCSLNVLFTGFLAKLDVKKFDDDEDLKVVHVAFLNSVLEIWNLHNKQLLKYCDNAKIKGKGVIALYYYYRDRRDKISKLIFEMFHPIVENLLSFMVLYSPKLVTEFKDVRSRLESFYIVCWDTCEYLELCLKDIEVIHDQKSLRPIVPCATHFLGILKMLCTLSFYWKAHDRFLDILHRMHFIIQSKIQSMLNTGELFRLENRVAVAICRDIVYVSEFWRSAVEQDRAFSQKVNFETLVHMRDVAQSVLDILLAVKNYNRVYCDQCYDVENESYKLDAVVQEAKELTAPFMNPDFDYLDVDNKAQWLELVAEFKRRCVMFDKEASRLILDAIKKTKSTRNITGILVHFRNSTKQYGMESLFDEIFSNLDISSQFSNEIVKILEVFLKAAYHKDSMRSFGLASKNMQWTRCLFYVVQKNLNNLFSIGTVLPSVYDKVITNYLRCVDVFTSFEVGLYKVWLKRFTDYTEAVVTKKLVQLAYDKNVVDDDSDKPEPEFLEYLPQFRRYLANAINDVSAEKLESLSDLSSGDDGEEELMADYKRNLLLKYGIDLDNWYAERFLLNYNFVKKLALGLCTQNDEQQEANVYFLLESILKRCLEKDDKTSHSREKLQLMDGIAWYQPYDCCSSSGSVTEISELLTDETWSDNDDRTCKESLKFLVDRDPENFEKLTRMEENLAIQDEDRDILIAVGGKMKQRINDLIGGDLAEIKKKFTQKTEEICEAEEDSEGNELFDMPEIFDRRGRCKKVSPPISSEIDELQKYKILFKTPTDKLYNYKEMAFVLWLNSIKMKYVKPKKAKNQVSQGQNMLTASESQIQCSCGKGTEITTDKCPECDFDWTSFDPNMSKGHNKEDDSSAGDDSDASSVRGITTKMEAARSRKRRFRREAIEKYEYPMNDVFVDHEEVDSRFRQKFNIYLTKLINESNQPGEMIGASEISGKVRGSVTVVGELEDKSATLAAITDDDMPEQKIDAEINRLSEMQKRFYGIDKRSFKKELNEAIRQADRGESSGSEKALMVMDYDQEIKKVVPGIYTKCKHALDRISWKDFIGNDILFEHGYTINANREPFTATACRDIENLDELGFTLPPKVYSFAFNNFDSNKHRVNEIISLYKGIIGGLTEAKLMVLKPYIKPVETDICTKLRSCGLRSLNTANICKELIVMLNRLAILNIHVSEIENSIKTSLDTVGRLNFYRTPYKKSYSVKEFFSILNTNTSHTHRRLLKLYKLTRQKLIKMETLLYQQQTGKCEYMIEYYRSTEKMICSQLIKMVRANLFIFRKFLLGETKSRFHVVPSIVEPNIILTPDLVIVDQNLRLVADKIIRYLKMLPRWFDGTCAKVPFLKRKGGDGKNVHMYSFAEDVIGSVEVVEDLQLTYESISYVLDVVDDYVHSWSRFEHLWTEDIEEAYTKFASSKPSLEDFNDVFNFYHQIIVEMYKYPDHVDIYCIRVKIKDLKKKILMYALGWRAYVANVLNDSIKAEAQILFSVMQNYFDDLTRPVDSFEALKRVLKAAYTAHEVEVAADIVANSIAAKTSLAKLWMPPHLYVDTNLRKAIVSGMKQLKSLALYKRTLLTPYMDKITPRVRCIQCSTSGLATDHAKLVDNLPKTFASSMNEVPMACSLKNKILKLINELETIRDACHWRVVGLLLGQLVSAAKVIDWFSLLHPKPTLPKLQTVNQIHQLLGMEKPQVETKEQSLEELLKLLK